MTKKALVVDDSSVMVMSVKQTLEISGFSVETANNGQQALDRLNSGYRPDLVITDINMPVMDGLEFIRQARSLIRFTPILALTTESQASKRDEAKKNGATGWLVKPVQNADLIEVVKKVVPGI